MRKDWEREIYKRCDEEDKKANDDANRDMDIDDILLDENWGNK